MNPAKQMSNSMMMPMSGMMPMPMVSTGMMTPLMCEVSCKMDKKMLVCEMTPMAGTTLEMMQACCDAMNRMGDMGAAYTVQCCNMSMMMSMSCEMKKDKMICKMMCAPGMTLEMMACCCEAMMKCCGMGMPMMVCCNGMPMMCCMMD